MTEGQIAGLVLVALGVGLFLLARRLVWDHSPDNPAAVDRGEGFDGVWPDKRLAFHRWRGWIAGVGFAALGLLLLTEPLWN